MSGIAGVVMREAPAAPAALERMLGCIAHRGPDGVRQWCEGPAALGHACLALTVAERGRHQPHVSASGCVVVADACIHNRSEVVRALGLSPAPGGDAALILAAWERRGDAVLDLLEGDFAFAIWDPRARCLFAARDPFGARPLFYRETGAGLAFGSEPKQCLAFDRARSEPDPVVVGEYLLGRFQDATRTFLDGVRRLRPGHLLVVHDGTPRERRWWWPDVGAEVRYPDPRDYALRFRELLRAAVRRRLRTEHPVAVQLSGGMDSSSVVVVAAALCREAGAGCPPLETYSCVYPGLPCDETRYSRSVSRGVPFAHRELCPLDEPLLEGLDADFASLGTPFIDIQRTGHAVEAELLRRIEARSVLTGLGGDELCWQDRFLRDLARRGALWRMLVEARRGARGSLMSFPALAADGVREILPLPVKRLYRGLRALSAREPGWLSDELRGLFARCPPAPPMADLPWPSLSQRFVFENLSHPLSSLVIETLEARYARFGVACAHPFLDRALAEFVLAVPFEARRLDGRWKHLLHEAVADLLPAEVREIRPKTTFESLHRALLVRHGPALLERLSGAWRAAAFVRETPGRRLIGCAVRDGTGVDLAWRIATVELWLRWLERDRPVTYNRDGLAPRMSETTRQEGHGSPVRAQA